MVRSWIPVVAALALAGGGCKGSTEASPDPEGTSAPPASASSTAASADPARKLRLIAAPAEGGADDVVHAAIAKASAEHRRVVVYVGATWCEPCQRFHHSAERGELDSVFPDIDMVTFDADRDAERLASAGYFSKYIPLFALPDAAGRASGKQIEGGVKGDGAVGYIAPRLKKMLLD